ncbi:MAG: phosphoribosylanthranilate isomerase [Candidatus Magnetoovum sp. WYHC-5]|nr:phosphoribosylanthranilate isomerase [Candidatus Magnetoovum sp. WYHC-5]
MVKIKICGITRLKDALWAVDCGVDALGFVFYEKSPRKADINEVKKIIRALPPFVVTVGVFVNEDGSKIDKIIAETGINAVQLHGSETPQECTRWPCVIKAFRVKEGWGVDVLKQYSVKAVLLDNYVAGQFGGTGEVFNWEIAKTAKAYGNVILAGGLTVENVKSAVAHVSPYALDVSSGVESSPGIKDHLKIKDFIKEAKIVIF